MQQTRTLLIIDDCPMMRRFLAPVFKDNFQVVELSSASEALVWIAENPAPAAILLDYELPDLSGLEVLTHIRKRTGLAHVPVLMLSGIKDAEKRWQCLEAGANDFLSKPFHPKELALRVKKACPEKTPVTLSYDNGPFIPQPICIN